MQQVLSFGKQLEKPFEPGRSMGFISPVALTPLAAPLVLCQSFAAPRGCSFMLASSAIWGKFFRHCFALLALSGQALCAARVLLQPSSQG